MYVPFQRDYGQKGAFVNRFAAGVYAPMRLATYEKSAQLYRSLRKKGITIQKPVDCMIASVAIEHDLPLLHHDRDFDNIAKHSKLKTVE